MLRDLCEELGFGTFAHANDMAIQPTITGWHSLLVPCLAALIMALIRAKP
jgi:hypothetical protein